MALGSNPATLAGVTVVVTRPEKQGWDLLNQLNQLGARALAFPCVEIQAVDADPQLQALPVTLDEVDLFIFTSVNAVHNALTRLPRLQQHLRGPQAVAAIGQSSADLLRQQGITDILAPATGFDSENLLQLPPLQQIEGLDILIFKGSGGRKKLLNELSARQARVHTVDVYQRAIPAHVDASLLEQGADVIFFTSGEVANNMLRLVPNRLHDRLLLSQPIVGHVRIAEKVAALGFKKLPIIAINPSDAEMLAALVKWAKKERRN